MNRVCTGCFNVFFKTHLLLNHRRSFRCGGEWNETVYIPTHRFAVYEDSRDMVYLSRPGLKYDPLKPYIVDPSLNREDSFRHNIRKAQRKKARRHKMRTPGTIRVSRMQDGSGFRNNWED